MRPLHSTPKGYTAESDKLCSPAQTVAKVKARFNDQDGILAESRRTDTGRLGIPVYLSLCGPKARQYMPTRKQMGKGATPEQAEASGLMELAERYSFFTFWAEENRFTQATWSQALELWPGKVLPLSQVLAGVGDTLDEGLARQVMDLVSWRFHPATRVLDGQEVMVPLDLFKKLNEFNGLVRRELPGRVDHAGSLRAGGTPCVRPDRQKMRPSYPPFLSKTWPTRSWPAWLRLFPRTAFSSGSRISAWACPSPP